MLKELGMRYLKVSNNAPKFSVYTNLGCLVSAYNVSPFVPIEHRRKIPAPLTLVKTELLHKPLPRDMGFHCFDRVQ